MIKLLVWSKDRACQLDFLLRSIDKFSPNTFDTIVIYKASNEKYEEAYQKLTVNKVRESDSANFRKLTLDAIRQSKEKWLGVSTDDTVVYLPFVISEKDLDGIDVFSLRCGLNTVVQDPHKQTYQPPLHNYIDEGNTISWDFTKYHPHDNYGYPFGLDMHLYRRDKFLALISSFDWKNTNELETGLFHRKMHILPVIRSFKQSVAFNVPVNNMSGATVAGKFYANSIESLNDLFLQGQRISMNSLNNVIVSGAHQEIKYVFEGQNVNT